MQKRPRKEIQLGEATVKATKLMMVMKGDTLVYNADAFQLAEGSMLDKLISMLPGVELKKDGVITVNGRRVDRLLVNGEDFFTGSPKVALENLPACTVDKVKVYERMNDRDRALGYTKEEVGKQPLAMDVQLKKQYSMGGFANVGGAYGTDGHYGARLFALRFTRQSRIGAYANINDFKGGSYYDSNGNWQTASGGSMATTKDAGLYYLINDRRKRFKVDGSTRFRYFKDPRRARRRPPRFSTAVTCSVVRVNAAWRTNWWPTPLSTSKSPRPTRGFSSKRDPSSTTRTTTAPTARRRPTGTEL